MVVRLASAATLARLLTPEAYGLHGMAAVVFGFLYMARDFGIVTALQQPEITPAAFNALCRFAIAGGFGLALLGAILGVPTGWWFGETTRVPAVMAGLCAGFIFSSSAAPAIGALYREQRAGQVAMLEATALAIGAIAAVAAAWAHWGVWALVTNSLVAEAALCALAWRACPWRPSADIAGVSWRRLARFGAALTGHNVVSYCRTIVDQITVGRTAGASALGFYGRGAQLPALPAQIVIGPFAPWILATLAAQRNAPAEFTRFFRHALNGLFHIALAAAIPCIAVPELTLAVFLGPEWSSAAPVARWLGVGLIVQPIVNGTVWLLGAAGEVRRLLFWSVTSTIVTAMACLAAAPYGPSRIALAAGIATVIQAMAGPAFCRSCTPITARDWWQPLARPLLLHGPLIPLVFAADRGLPLPQALALRLGLLIAGAGAYYGAMMLIFPRLRDDLRNHIFRQR